MNPRADYYEWCADETGYPADTLEKVARLGVLAGAVAAHPYLQHALALKGGTALNLCLGAPPPRLSVDLDYNYVAHAERAAMQADRPRIEEALKDLIQRLGFRLQLSGDAFAGRRFFAHYPSVFGSEDRVEVDLNFLWRVPLDGIAAAEMWQPGELERPAIRMVSPMELGVGKLLAMLDRTALRDVWDTARLPLTIGETLTDRSFRRMLIALSAMLPHPLYRYTQAVLARRIESHTRMARLLSVRTDEDRPAAGELLKRAWSVVSPFLGLDENEQAYVDGIHAAKVDMQLLFPDDPALAERIAGHPAIAWKLRNTAKQQKRRGRPSDLENG